MLHCPSCDHIVTAALAESGKLFCYKHRIQGMSASGTIQFGNREYKLTPGRSFGSFGWSEACGANRANGSGAEPPASKTDLSSLESGFRDGNRLATENVIFCRGTAHKLSDARLGYPPKQVDAGGRRLAHFFDDGRIDLVFTPHSRHENRVTSDLRLERSSCLERTRGTLCSTTGRTRPFLSYRDL